MRKRYLDGEVIANSDKCGEGEENWELRLTVSKKGEGTRREREASIWPVRDSLARSHGPQKNICLHMI